MKLFENVTNEFGLTEKENLTRVSWLIDTGFSR